MARTRRASRRGPAPGGWRRRSCGRRGGSGQLSPPAPRATPACRGQHRCRAPPSPPPAPPASPALPARARPAPPAGRVGLTGQRHGARCRPPSEVVLRRLTAEDAPVELHRTSCWQAVCWAAVRFADGDDAASPRRQLARRSQLVDGSRRARGGRRRAGRAGRARRRRAVRLVAGLPSCRCRGRACARLDRARRARPRV